MVGTERLSKTEAVQLLELIEDSRRCADMEGFRRLICSLGGLMSFDMAVCGTARFDCNGALDNQRIVNISYPEEWLNLYAEQDLAMIDPVVRAHMTDFSARTWSDAYCQWGRPQPFLSIAEDFGIRNGYCFGALSPAERTASIFSLCTDRKNSGHSEKMLDILAPHFHEALLRSMQQNKASDTVSPLTPRETEVVRWLANGKNCWEISVILGISERTVKFHTSALQKKLGASNRTHAVARALTFGLISLDC